MTSHMVDVLPIKSNGVLVTGVSTAVINSDSIDVSGYAEAIVFINLTAETGTSPTLDCKIQYSQDGANWADSGDAFTQMTTSTGVFLKKLSANFGKFIRLVFTPGGTTPVYTITPNLVAKT